MDGYVEIQQRLVADRQKAYRAEADEARLLASASPLPAVSAGSRAAAATTPTWPADGEPIAASQRELGAASATGDPALMMRSAPSASVPASAARGQRSECADGACLTDIAPAA
jgi:hypothetical protein